MTPRERVIKAIEFGDPGRASLHPSVLPTAWFKYEGGLIAGFEIAPDVPLENMEAACEAFLEYGMY